MNLLNIFGGNSKSWRWSSSSLKSRSRPTKSGMASALGSTLGSALGRALGSALGSPGAGGPANQLFTGEANSPGLTSCVICTVNYLGQIKRHEYCRGGPDSEVDPVCQSQRRRCNSGVCHEPEPDLVSIPEGKAIDLTLARSFSLSPIAFLCYFFDKAPSLYHPILLQLGPKTVKDAVLAIFIYLCSNCHRHLSI